MLKKVECFLNPSRLDKVKDELVKIGIDGMSVSEVKRFLLFLFPFVWMTKE